jgi:hypothetical protein
MFPVAQYAGVSDPDAGRPDHSVQNCDEWRSVTTADPFTDARADIERARAGEDATTELASHLDRLSAMPWSTEKYAVERVVRLALLASPSRDGLERALADCFPMGMQTVRGPMALLLREGDPLSAPFPEAGRDNPWGIARGATLVERSRDCGLS